MEILKFDEGDTKPKSRKFSSRGSILVAAVAIMFGASTALAGSTLTINTANQIEISQGVAQTVQCDSDKTVNVSLETAYEPDTFKFMLSKIKITDIDATGCNDKIFTVKLYGGTYNDLVTFCLIADSNCEGGTSYSGPVAASSLTFTFATPVLDIASASTVKNVTVVSSDPA